MFLEDVENTLQSMMYDVPGYKAFFKKELGGLKYLRQFGEIAYVKFGDKIKGKLENRGFPMMYLGRPRNHSADTYRFLNLATDRVVHSRDATWLNRVYGDWLKLSKPVMPEMVTMMPIDKLEKEQSQESEQNPQDEQPEPVVQPERVEQPQ